MTHDDTFFCNGHSNLPDLENDKIKITCDDDLKFFMEESPCHKVIFDFAPDSDQELSRKRNLSQVDEESWEVSKKIRKQLSQIDLSSDSSMMETDSDDDLVVSSTDSSKNSSVLNVAQQPPLIPSTSKQAREELLASQSAQKVNIISVEVVKQPVEIQAFDTVIIDSPDSVIFDSETILIPDENGNDAQVVPGNQVIAQEEPSLPEPAVEQENVQKKAAETKTKRVETNRIVISDSEEDAEDATNGNEQWRGRRTGAYSSSYSFSGANGNMHGGSCGFGMRGDSPPRHHRRGHHGRHGHHRHSFQEGRNYQDWRFRHAENMARAQEQARMARENVRRASESAANAVRASAAFIPDMMANFRAHFQRPMFSVADINQQIFGRR